MPQHTVKQGEHMADIAAQYGFADYRPIWEHAGNAALREQRKDPNVLMEGDVVTIPAVRAKTVKCKTGSFQTFRMQRPKIKIRFAIQDFTGAPVASTRGELTVDGAPFPCETDADGVFEQEVPAGAKGGRLSIADLEIDFKIGHLDPVAEIAGWRARLNNLGYDAGDSEDPEDARIRSAIEEFQCENDIEVSGEMDAATQSKLVEVYGC
jgi:hypothetical protein